MIPVDNALETANFESDVDWSKFRYQVAIEMGVKKDKLKLGYKFSTSTQKELPRHLNSAEHLSALFDTARDILKDAVSSRSKAKAKPLNIVLANPSPDKAKN
jgi:hypothetical protein